MFRSAIKAFGASDSVSVAAAVAAGAGCELRLKKDIKVISNLEIWNLEISGSQTTRLRDFTFPSFHTFPNFQITQREALPWDRCAWRAGPAGSWLKKPHPRESLR